MAISDANRSRKTYSFFRNKPTDPLSTTISGSSGVLVAGDKGKIVLAVDPTLLATITGSGGGSGGSPTGSLYITGSIDATDDITGHTLTAKGDLYTDHGVYASGSIVAANDITGRTISATNELFVASDAHVTGAIYSNASINAGTFVSASTGDFDVVSGSTKIVSPVLDTESDLNIKRQGVNFLTLNVLQAFIDHTTEMTFALNGTPIFDATSVGTAISYNSNYAFRTVSGETICSTDGIDMLSLTSASCVLNDYVNSSSLSLETTSSLQSARSYVTDGTYTNPLQQTDDDAGTNIITIDATPTSFTNPIRIDQNGLWTIGAVITGVSSSGVATYLWESALTVTRYGGVLTDLQQANSDNPNTMLPPYFDTIGLDSGSIAFRLDTTTNTGVIIDFTGSAGTTITSSYNAWARLEHAL